MRRFIKWRSKVPLPSSMLGGVHVREEAPDVDAAIGRLLAGRHFQLVLAGLGSAFQPRRTLSPVTGPLVTPVPSLTAQSICSRLTDWYRHSFNWSSISFSIRSERLRPSSSLAARTPAASLASSASCCASLRRLRKLLHLFRRCPLAQRLRPAVPAPPWPDPACARQLGCGLLGSSASVGTGVGEMPQFFSSVGNSRSFSRAPSASVFGRVALMNRPERSSSNSTLAVAGHSARDTAPDHRSSAARARCACRCAALTSASRRPTISLQFIPRRRFQLLFGVKCFRELRILRRWIHHHHVSHVSTLPSGPRFPCLIRPD